MTKNDFNKTFGKDDSYFTGYLSDTKLSDIPDQAVATIVTQHDMELVADQIDSSMGDLMPLYTIFAIILYILIIYLLAKQIIEKNLQSISMLKIIGYNDNEITKIYNSTTGIVMFISLLISLPIDNLLIKQIYFIMMNKFSGWFSFKVAWWIWPISVLLGMFSYFVVYFIQKKKTAKIQLSEALKNNE